MENALLFAARQSRGAESLHTVLQENPHLPDWCTVIISLELALLENRLDSALPGLTHVHRQPASPYLPYYQVERLLRHGRPDLADTLLNAYGGSFPATEAAFLRLQVFRTQGAIALLDPAYDNLLRNPLTPHLATKFCSYLIANGTPGQLARYLDRFATGGPTLTAETLPLYQATYVVAALAGDQAHADRIHEAVAKFSSSDYRALNGLAELLKTRKPDGRMPRLLPLVQLPIEVLYAILEPPAPAAAK